MAYVTTLCDHRRVNAAFFDLDKTIIARSSPLAFGRSFYRQGLIGRGFLLKGIYAQLVFVLMGADENKMEKMRRQAAHVTAGWEPERVRKVVTEVLEEVITPLIYAEAAELIREHREAERVVCIVSSSPEEIVEPLAEMIGAEHWIATKPEIVDGKYTGELTFYAYGPHKADAIKELAEREGIDLGGSYAYTDSITDVPLLEAVGHPVAVNPDRSLRALAHERRWEITTFRNPVTLRSRLPQLRAPTTRRSRAAAALTIAGFAVLAWWTTRRVPGKSSTW